MSVLQPQSVPVANLATYAIFDTAISSRIALPELPGCSGRTPCITVRWAESARREDEQFSVRHEWRREGGPLICSSARLGADYLLSFPDCVSFRLSPVGTVGCTIDCSPAPGVAEGLVRQRLLNQVIPRYLAHTGELLLHASAVTLPNGKTVAFLGESGHGKSTLASYCHQQGAQLIDDDCILVRMEEGRVSIIGGVPTIRLYPDSLQALGHSGAAFVPCVDDAAKQQMTLTAGSTPGGEPRLLDALLVLGPALPANDVVRIEPAGGQAAMMAILCSAFSLDPSAPDTMTRTFAQAARLLSGQHGLRVQRLLYPRQHMQLPNVLRALLDHQRG